MRFQKMLAWSASISIAGALLASCSGTVPTGSSIPSSGAGMQARGGAHFDRQGRPARLTLLPANVGIARLHIPLGHARPIKMMKPPKGGIYGSMFGSPGYNGYENVYGFTNPNSTNGPSTCTIDANYVNGFGVDPKGVTIVPGYFGSAYSSETNFYAGPYTCGSLMATIPDSGGQPADAYSENAATGPTAIGEIENNTSHQGDMMVCTLSGSSGSCGAPLTNTSESTEYCPTTYDCIIPYVAGVAIDKKGNCYESGYTGSSYPWTPVLFYWEGCTGDALIANGVSNRSYGGIAIDNSGNVVMNDFVSTTTAPESNLYVYTCKYTKAKHHKTITIPASYNCSLESTTAMEGETLFFGIGKDAMLAAGDFGNGTVDMYNYSPSGSTYSYSISNGFATGWTEAGAVSPSMK